MKSAGGEPLVALREIYKSFGSIRAVRGASLEVRAGEIVAIVGDNGAGKSTLIKVLTGAIAADRGTITVEGREVTISKPHDAQQLGIAAIYQDLALFNNLDVGENVFAGREETTSFLGLRFLRRKRMAAAAHEAVADLGIRTLHSARPLVGSLSGGQRQMIAVARAIGMNARILILDEPTAALGIRESAVLLDQARRLRDQGLGIVLITHRLPDALELANRIVVMKAGEVHGILEPPGCTLEDIADLIVRGRQTGGVAFESAGGE
jgi:ABC-type sugar transport system ATPase subunit